MFKTSSDNPKAPATYVVFGKAEIEDLSAQATSAAVEQFKAPGAGLDVSSPSSSLHDAFHTHPPAFRADWALWRGMHGRSRRLCGKLRSHKL